MSSSTAAPTTVMGTTAPEAAASTRQETGTPDLVISLINHSNPELLRECLRTLYAGTSPGVRLDVWVVDNATDGRLVSEIRAEFPETRWLFNRERLGFSANHNQVLKQAQGRYLCILNDDIVVHPGAFDTLVRFLDENPEAGIAGPRLLNPDGTQQDCTFRFPTLFSEWAAYALLPGPLTRLQGREVDPAQFAGTSAAVDWILGACMVFRRETLEQIGLLDDEMAPIVYMEEPDVCLRAHRAGWKTLYCPQATLTHYGGQTTKDYAATLNPLTLELNRVHIAFFRKHYGPLASLAVRLIYTLMLPWNALMLTLMRLRGSITRAQFQSLMLLYSRVASLSLFSSCRTPLIKPALPAKKTRGQDNNVSL